MNRGYKITPLCWIQPVSVSNELRDQAIQSKLCQATKFQKVGTRFLQLESKTPLKPSFGRWPFSMIPLNRRVVSFDALTHCIVQKTRLSMKEAYFRSWGIEDLVNACPQLAMIIDLTHTDRCCLDSSTLYMKIYSLTTWDYIQCE